MNLKYPIYLLFIFCLHSASAQSTDTRCKCTLLEPSEENDTKVTDIAREIEESFHNESIEGFIKYFDSKSFTDRIIKKEGIDTLDNFNEGFIKGLGETHNNVAQRIVSEIKNGAYYNLINYHYSIIEQAYYFTFRIYSESIGINYHDYKVCSDGNHIMVNDLFVYLTGEHLSETVGRLYLLSKPRSKISLKNLFGFKSPALIENFSKAKKQAEEGNFERAYEYLSELDGESAKEKFILILRASYASMYDDDLYGSVLKEFADLYPNDLTLYLKQIDYYALKGDYDKSIQNIDELMFETQDDFLNLMKGNIYILSEDFVNAEKKYEYMTTNYPNLFEGYSGYMVSLNYQDRFEEIAEVLDKLIKDDYNKDWLVEFVEQKEPDGSNALEKFEASEVYKKWKQKP